MSASPIARQATQTQAIPSRRVLITDPSQMPDVYSSTPGGTVYSTTPGDAAITDSGLRCRSDYRGVRIIGGSDYRGPSVLGTRIVYERSFMMSLRQSPISQTPPKCSLPAALLKDPTSVPASQISPVQKPRSNSISFDESLETFSMDL